MIVSILSFFNWNSLSFSIIKGVDLKIFILFFVLLLFSCTKENLVEKANWCDENLRAGLTKLKEIDEKNSWFKTYEVGENVYAIAEPYNFQEIISYLIIGKEKALLFDTGMGMDSISNVVKQLTNLPIVVLNSHNHYDHIGGNHEFKNILSMGVDYAIERSKNGIDHNGMKHEVADNAFCAERLPQLDRSTYTSRPFSISTIINDGHIIDLGDREIEVILSPGHMPDAIAIYDKKNGYLWTGDTFYLGPIWLFDKMTDLAAYENSIDKYAKLVPNLTKVFPAHNNPIAEPFHLTELKDALKFIKHGNPEKMSTGDYNTEGNKSVRFNFEHFSFMIRTAALENYKVK